MPEQVRRAYTPSQTRREQHQAESLPSHATPEQRQKHLEELDALLDDIDEVLEEDAAEFVSAYIQKGGQ